MNLDSDTDPPSGSIWRPEWIPPLCPPECRIACPPVFGIFTYSISVFRNRQRTDPRTLRPTTRDIIIVGATEWYFDRYGCRKFDAEASAALGAAALATTLFLAPKNTPDLAAYWPEARQALMNMGVPAPGHVRILPRGAQGIAALAYAATGTVR